MPVDLSKYLVIGISTRALFDLEYENTIFDEQGLKAYSDYQLEHEDDLLGPGVGFPLVRVILNLNNHVSDRRHAEVIIMSRNNADASLRIFKSIQHHGLDITRGAFTSGASLARYLRAFSVGLFLSADEEDVRSALQAGVAAAQIISPPPNLELSVDQLRIAFDGDAVIFSDEAEQVYQSGGLGPFQDHERENARLPLPEGPFAKLLLAIAYHQADMESSKIRTALITARNSPAHERVIRTLRTWGVRIDEVFFMGGLNKAPILQAFGAHMFFDDQRIHLTEARLCLTNDVRGIR